jgi:hypothetical protein
MGFDVQIAHEACCSRIALRGQPSPGHVLSLLQVLELDSAAWPQDAVLLDLRELQTPLDDQEQVQVARETARTLGRARRVAVLAPSGCMREADGVRVFVEEHEALRWLAQPGSPPARG